LIPLRKLFLLVFAAWIYWVPLAAQNLVRNPGFEEGTQGGWGHFIPTENNEVDCRMGVDGPGRGGRLAAWIEAPAFARHGILQKLGSVSNGERLRLAAWVRVDGKTLLGKRTPGVLVRLNFLGSNGLSVKDDRGQSMAIFGWLGGKQCHLGDIEKITLPPAIPAALPMKTATAAAKPAIQRALPPNWGVPGTNWGRIDLVCEAPPGSVGLELGLFAWWVQGRVWFDDIWVERAKERTPLTPFFR
jgi:hypothetical protein